eukprot:223473_1
MSRLLSVQPTSSSIDNAFEYVIVGAGPAMLTACGELVRSGIHKKRKICLISSDKLLVHGHIPRSKKSIFKKGLALSSICVRQFLFQEMIRKYCKMNHITSKLSTITKNIDYQNKIITTDKGESIRYNKLLLAIRRLGKDTLKDILYGVNIGYSLSEKQIKQCVFRNIAYENVTSITLRKWTRSECDRNRHCVVVTKLHHLHCCDEFSQLRLHGYQHTPPHLHHVLPDMIDSFIGDGNGNIQSVKLRNGTLIPAHVVKVDFRATSNTGLPGIIDSNRQKKLSVNKWLQSELNSDVFVCGDYYFLSHNNNWEVLGPACQGVYRLNLSSSATFAVQSMTNTLNAKQKRNGYPKGLDFAPYQQFAADNMITIPNKIKMDTASYPQIVRNTVCHLVFGFIRSEFGLFPVDLKQCIWRHFIGDFLSIFAFKSNRMEIGCFSQLQPLHQDQLLHIIIKLLCPGDDNQHKHLIKRLISSVRTHNFDGIDVRTRLFDDWQFGMNASKTRGRLKHIMILNVGILSEYVQICNVYSMFDEQDNRNMLCRGQQQILFLPPKLVISLIEKKPYYELYLRTFADTNTPRTIERMIRCARCYLTSNMYRVQRLRRFLVPLILGDVTFAYNHTFDLSLLFAIFESIPSCNRDDWDLRYQVKWRWLEQEIQAHTVEQNKEHKASMELLLNRCLTYIINNHLQMSSNQDPASAEIVFRVLYLLQKWGVDMTYTYSITHWHDFEELITGLLRTDEKFGMLGFMILQMEINKWKENKHQYGYRDEFVSYIDNKAGLFQVNVKECLATLKWTKDGNIQLKVREQIHKATEVCFDINEILRCTKDNAPRFNSFYRKMKATKLIKPIIQQLQANIE